MSLDHYKPNELEMALRIALKGIDQLLEQKQKGGLVVNKGTDIEARMSYKEAKLCVERIQRQYSVQGAFSLGICGSCKNWSTAGHCTGNWEDMGSCKLLSGKTTHRYDCCDKHSKENGGWGL